jgi:hypothetical protein
MNYYVKALAAVAVVMTAAAPAFADTTQVVAQPGVSLTEAAQAKFNRDTRSDDRQFIVHPGQTAAEAAVSPLNVAFVAKINKESRGDEKQAVKGGQVTMASRSPVVTGGNAQLIASAGLSADAAAGLSLTEIAAAKFAHDTATDDR